MIGRAPFVDAVKPEWTTARHAALQGERARRSVRPSSKPCAAQKSFLFCVKTTDNAETARALAPLLAPSAIVVSMQNGVDNAEQIRAASGIDALAARRLYRCRFVPRAGHRQTRAAAAIWSSARATHGPNTSAALFERAERPLPHLRQHRRRALDQAHLELRAQRHLGARPREVRPNRRKRPMQKKSSPNVVTEFLAVARAAKIHPPDFEESASDASQRRLKGRRQTLHRLLLHRTGSSAWQTHRDRLAERLHRPPRRRTKHSHPSQSSPGHAGKAGRIPHLAFRVAHSSPLSSRGQRRLCFSLQYLWVAASPATYRNPKKRAFSPGTLRRYRYFFTSLLLYVAFHSFGGIRNGICAITSTSAGSPPFVAGRNFHCASAAFEFSSN